MFAYLVGNHAQQVPGVGETWFHGEDLPIELLGRLKPTGLMVLNRDRQCFGNGCHRANYGNTPRQPQRAFRQPATHPAHIQTQQTPQQQESTDAMVDTALPPVYSSL
jgi:hypothetical protein